MGVLGTLAGIAEIAKATFGGDGPKGGDGKTPPARRSTVPVAGPQV